MFEHSSGDLVKEVETLRKRLAQSERAVTRHKKAEERALQKAAELEQLLADRRREGPAPSVAGTEGWFAGLIHELKQPLTAIVNYIRACCHLVETGQIDSRDLRHALEQASLQADRAAELLRNLRRVSVPTARQPSPMEIADVIREAVHLLEGEFLAAKIQMETHFADTVAAIQADPLQIRLVLLNLLRNAIEAIERSKAGERSIRIAVEQRATEIEVAIRDTGEGLSLQAVHNLFEPFQTTQPQGTGIGLALCRAIVQAHGGRLWAKPHANRGTTFFFTLPKTPKL